jgi:hypothetical protein
MGSSEIISSSVSAAVESFAVESTFNESDTVAGFLSEQPVVEKKITVIITASITKKALLLIKLLSLLRFIIYCSNQVLEFALSTSTVRMKDRERYRTPHFIPHYKCTQNAAKSFYFIV